MKIDLCNRSQLLKKKATLTKLLEVVDFAICQFSASDEQNSEIRQGDRPVWAVIAKLGDKFTTSDVMLGFGEAAKENRYALKRSLLRFQRANLLRVIEQGRGRKPTQYEKVSPPTH